MVVGGHFHGRYVESISKNMISKNKQIRLLIQKEDFKSAEKLCTELADYLNSKKIALSVIADHMMIENIEKNLAEMHSYTTYEQKFDSISACDILGVLLVRMKKAFLLSIENIF